MTAKRETRVLFNWKPRVLDHSLGDRLQKRLIRAGCASLRALVEVRDPELNAKLQKDDTLGWHCDMTGNNLPLVMWSNVRPTQVRFKDGSLLESKDGDVLLIYNAEVVHRAPDDQTDRWFLRVTVATIDLATIHQGATR